VGDCSDGSFGESRLRPTGSAMPSTILFPVVGIVTKIYYTDDIKNPSGIEWGQYRCRKSDEPSKSTTKGVSVVCDVIVCFSNTASSFPLARVPVIQRKSGFDNYSEEYPNPSSNYDQYLANKVSFSDLDGDAVFIQFIGGRKDRPVITGWYPTNVFDPAAVEDGQRYFRRHQGTKQIFDKEGNYTLDTTEASSTIDPIYRTRGEAPEVGGDVTVKVKKNRTVRLDLGDSNFITIKNIDGELQMSLKDENGQHAVLGENLLDHLNKMKSDFTNFYNKEYSQHTHLGNLGWITQLIPTENKGLFPQATNTLLSKNLVLANINPSGGSSNEDRSNDEPVIDDTPSPEEQAELDASIAERVVRSSNQSKRSDPPTITMIVIQHTGTETMDEAVSKYSSTSGQRPSVHYVVDIDGSLVQMVAESKKAWHVGPTAYYGDITNVNDVSIGIAVVNVGRLSPTGSDLSFVSSVTRSIKLFWKKLTDGPEKYYRDKETGSRWASYPDVQIDAVRNLVRNLKSRYSIEDPYIISRSEVVEFIEEKDLNHYNNGNCQKCEVIMGRYPGFYGPLYSWFKSLQKAHPEAHVNNAGRNKTEQEALKKQGAPGGLGWGSSNHNWNAALDINRYVPSPTSDDPNRVVKVPDAMHDYAWFESVVDPSLPPDLIRPLPDTDAVHVHPVNYRQLRNSGTIALVGEPSRNYVADLSPGPAFPLDQVKA